MSYSIEQAQKQYPEAFEPQRRPDQRAVADDLRDRRISGIMQAVDYLMTRSQLPPPVANTDALEAAIAELRRELAAVRADAAELRQELEDTKSRPLQSNIDKGIWQVGQDYSAGDLCSHDGSYFVALNATRSEPGKGAGWRLVALRGDRGQRGQPAFDLAKNTDGKAQSSNG